jgi:hypothetical protein
MFLSTIMFGSVLLGVVQRLDDRVPEHVKGQAGQVLERVYHGTDKVVIKLDLRQDVVEQKAWGAVGEFSQGSRGRFDIFFTNSLHNSLYTLLHCSLLSQE